MTKELDCEQAREFIRPDAGPLHPALRTRVETHVEGCPECRAYLALEGSLLHAYARLREQRAPEALRHKVVGAVRALQEEGLGAPPPAPSSSTRGRRPRWGVGALLAAAGLAALVLTLGPEAGEDGFQDSAYVTDFVRRATAGEHLATSDPGELRRFFLDRLGVALEPLVLDGLELESGEVCMLDGELGALILYKLDGRVLAHYLVPREGTPSRPPSQRALAPDEMLGMHDAGQVSMVTWASESVEQALVGEAPAESLAHVVRRGSVQ